MCAYGWWVGEAACWLAAGEAGGGRCEGGGSPDGFGGGGRGTGPVPISVNAPLTPQGPAGGVGRGAATGVGAAGC